MVKCPNCQSKDIARCYNKKTSNPVAGNAHICLKCKCEFGVVSKAEILELVASATLQDGFSIR